MQVTPEIQELKDKLIQEEGWKENVILQNVDVVADALHTSKLRDGLQVPVMSYSPNPNANVSYDTLKPVVNTSGLPVSRAEKDPVRTSLEHK